MRCEPGVATVVIDMEIKNILQDWEFADDEEQWCEALADWFEANPPSLENARPMFEFFLRRARGAASESAVAEYVVVALARGASWAQVAEALDTSQAEARDRFPGADSAALAESARWAEYTSSLATSAAAESSEWTDLLASAASEAAAVYAELTAAASEMEAPLGAGVSG